jgi:hypothetical protein
MLAKQGLYYLSHKFLALLTLVIISDSVLLFCPGPVQTVILQSMNCIAEITGMYHHN